MTKHALTRLFPFVCALLLASCDAEVGVGTPQEPVEEPASALHIIASFPEVGSSSRTIRILAPKLEAYLQRPVEIHYNEGGRGGDIGSRMAAAAPAEQLTLFVGTVGNISLLPNILPSYTVEPLKDFRPVTQLTVTPDVLIAKPTMEERGIDIPHGSWSGAFVPAATPAMETEQIFRALERALNDNDVVAQLAELGMIAAPSASPAAFRAYIEEELSRLGAVARAFNVSED